MFYLSWYMHKTCSFCLYIAALTILEQKYFTNYNICTKHILRKRV